LHFDIEGGLPSKFESDFDIDIIPDIKARTHDLDIEVLYL
jgi:hypothetical protein